MKTALSLLFIVASVSFAKASAGPPPFTNGSPLVSGVDGSYQATVRGTNLSGIIRFSYSGGNQTATTVGNLYAIFVDGQSYTGDVQAAVNTDTVGGVLETSTAVNSNTASGFFNGSMDQDSPYATFSGNGSLTLVNGTSTVATTNTETDNSSSSTGNSVTIASDVTGTGDTTGSTSTGGSSDSTSSAVTSTAAGDGTAVVTTAADGSQLVSNTTTTTTDSTTDPIVTATRSFKFSGVRNSQTSQ